jgi:hypothetical protein
MGLKGQISANHFPKNKYNLTFLGLPPITPTKVSGISEELDVIDLPDQTRASGGGRKATTVTITVPMQHLIQQGFLELWYKQGQGDVSPVYKKTGTLTYISLDGTVFRQYTLNGCFVTKRELPDLDMGDEGNMTESTWDISVDELLPV